MLLVIFQVHFIGVLQKMMQIQFGVKISTQLQRRARWTKEPQHQIMSELLEASKFFMISGNFRNL